MQQMTLMTLSVTDHDRPPATDGPRGIAMRTRAGAFGAAPLERSDAG